MQTWKHACLINCLDQYELFSFGISWCAEVPKRIGREVYMIKLLLASHECYFCFYCQSSPHLWNDYNKPNVLWEKVGNWHCEPFSAWQVRPVSLSSLNRSHLSASLESQVSPSHCKTSCVTLWPSVVYKSACTCRPHMRCCSGTPWGKIHCGPPHAPTAWPIALWLLGGAGATHTMAKTAIGLQLSRKK